MTRSDPEPPSYPEANEEALELSAGDGDAILDVLVAFRRGLHTACEKQGQNKPDRQSSRPRRSK